jgi:hypothetical protein
LCHRLARLRDFRVKDLAFVPSDPVTALRRRYNRH